MSKDFKNKNETLLGEEKISDNSITLREFFKEKGRSLQESCGIGLGDYYPQKEIAKKLNISIAQFRQKIYGEKPLTRDWLIAICAAYGLDEEDTNKAMIICNMPTFDCCSSLKLSLS